MADTDDQQESGRASELIASGSELAGAATGGALGLLGGPLGVAAGAVGGVAVTRVLKRVGLEIQARFLGTRQRIRVGAAFTFSADAIKARLDAGDQPRTDGFFSDDVTGRSDADELFEGVLIAASEGYEERKVKHLGWLYSSLVFDATTSAPDANYMLRIAEGLTYRQLVCLAMFGRVRELRDRLKSMGGRLAIARKPDPTDALMVELSDLGGDGLLTGAPTIVGGRWLELEDVNDVFLSELGANIYRLMRLDQIPASEIEDVVRELGTGPGYTVDASESAVEP